MKIAFVSFQWYFDKESASKIYNKSKQMLRKNPDIICPDNFLSSFEDIEVFKEKIKEEDIGCLIVQNGTFATGDYITKLVDTFKCPYVLWAVPEITTKGDLKFNSLCGVNLNSSILYELGIKYYYVYGFPDDRNLQNELNVILNSIRCINNLKHKNLGYIGFHAPGFCNLGFDELLIKKVFGMEVYHIELLKLRSVIENSPANNDEKNKINDFMEKLNFVGPERKTQKEKFFQLYLSYMRILKEYKINAIATRCWPDTEQLFKTRICSVLAFLSKLNVPCACEGDMYGVISMLIQEILVKTPSWLVDVVYMDTKKDFGTLWHCGNAPLEFAKDKKSPKIQKDGALNFVCKPGTITMSKVSKGKNGKLRMFIAKGEAIKSNNGFNGTSMNVRFKQNIKTVMDSIIANGFEHHFAVCYGDIEKELIILCNLLDIEICNLDS